jgi:hypothetical protein
MITDGKKKKLIRTMVKYYHEHMFIKKTNSDFEKCFQEGYTHLVCTGCKYRLPCFHGKESVVQNKNIIRELIEETINITQEACDWYNRHTKK